MISTTTMQSAPAAAPGEPRPAATRFAYSSAAYVAGCAFFTLAGAALVFSSGLFVVCHLPHVGRKFCGQRLRQKAVRLSRALARGLDVRDRAFCGGERGRVRGGALNAAGARADVAAARCNERRVAAAARRRPLLLFLLATRFEL